MFTLKESADRLETILRISVEQMRRNPADCEAFLSLTDDLKTLSSPDPKKVASALFDIEEIHLPVCPSFHF